MSTKLQSTARIIATPGGDRLAANVTADRTLVVNVADYNGYKFGPITISGLTPDEIDRIFDPDDDRPGDDDPLVVCWVREAIMLGITLVEAYLDSRKDREDNQPCQPVKQSTTVEGKGVKITTTTELSCPA